VSITNSNFKNISSVNGGAAYIETKNLKIANTSFESNKAQTGGALFLHESALTTI
jgi:predicted outer membrane repeat protein